MLNGKDAMQTVFLNLCDSNIVGACAHTLCRVEKQNLRNRRDQRSDTSQIELQSAHWKGLNFKSDISVNMDVFN